VPQWHECESTTVSVLHFHVVKLEVKHLFIILCLWQLGSLGLKCLHTCSRWCLTFGFTSYRPNLSFKGYIAKSGYL